MGKFNELIKRDPNLAAGILKRSFRHIINVYIPKIQLNNAEYDQLMDIILAGEEKDPGYIQDPDDIPDEILNGDKQEEGGTNPEEPDSGE